MTGSKLGRKRGSDAPKLSPHGRMLALLARGETFETVLLELHGRERDGLARTAQCLVDLTRVPSLRLRRKWVEHYLRTLEWAQPVRVHGKGLQWRVIDADGYVGRDRELRAEIEDSIDPVSGDVDQQWVERRRYCPGKRAGGLAAHSGRCPRTLRDHRAGLRALGWLETKRPRKRLPDGRFTYAQHWAVHPTRAMVKRWTEWGPARKRRLAERQRQLRAEMAADIRAELRDFDQRFPRADELRALGEAAERETTH